MRKNRVRYEVNIVGSKILKSLGLRVLRFTKWTKKSSIGNFKELVYCRQKTLDATNQTLIYELLFITDADSMPYVQITYRWKYVWLDHQNTTVFDDYFFV